MIHDNPHVEGLTIQNSYSFNKLPITSLAQHMRSVGLYKLYNTSYIYLIEVFFFLNDLETAFKLISPSNLEKLQKCELPLLVYFPHEGIGFKSANNWFLKLHHLMDEYKLHNTKKYLVFGRNMGSDVYHDFLKEHNLNISFEKIFDIEFFESLYYNVIKMLNLKFARLTYDKSVDFLSLNGRMRIHRELLISELSRRKLLSNRVSFLGYTEDILSTHNILMSGIEQFYPDIDQSIIDHLNSFVKDYKSIVIDQSELDDLNRFSTDNKHYEESYFSVVTETSIDHSIRLTEKVYKPMVNHHPFIVLGTQHTLSHLRELGYETFPEMFDESYDNEPNNIKRMLMAIDEIEKFCNLSKEEKDYKYSLVARKLKHNHNHFYIRNRDGSRFIKLFRYIKFNGST